MRKAGMLFACYSYTTTVTRRGHGCLNKITLALHGRTYIMFCEGGIPEEVILFSSFLVVSCPVSPLKNI